MISAGTMSAREDPLVAVDIVEKHAECAQALLQPALESRPVGARDRPRQQTEREDLLGAARVAVDRERDALLEQRVLGECLRAGELVDAERVPTGSCATRANGLRAPPLSNISSYVFGSAG